VQALVKKSTIARMLADDSPKSLATATGLGAPSSSCSYAAVALARALFRKSADFTAAMAFEIASTNLVIELGLIMALLLGWQFTLAEFVGGPLMILFIALLFRRFLTTKLVAAARKQADKAVPGSMEGHAAMDMSVTEGGNFWRRLASPTGFTAVAHTFVMEWAAVIRDIIIGLLIAVAAAAWIPDTFWQHLFLSDHPLAVLHHRRPSNAGNDGRRPRRHRRLRRLTSAALPLRLHTCSDVGGIFHGEAEGCDVDRRVWGEACRPGQGRSGCPGDAAGSGRRRSG